jgi:hypothetical protein
MKQFAADLHIHTALSPCAAGEMTPPAIVRTARQRGLNLIAICDHNTAGNAAATQDAAGRSLTVLAGMEITTAEEAHVLGLFPDAEAANAAADEVRATLPDADGDEPFGTQLLMGGDGEVLASEKKMLGGTSDFELAETVDLIRRYDGLAIAAHLDRPSFSVISQLGRMPEDTAFDAIEISAAAIFASRAREFSAYGLPVITSSDSHFLSAIGSCFTLVEMTEPTLDGLSAALQRLIEWRYYGA